MLALKIPLQYLALFSFYYLGSALKILKPIAVIFQTAAFMRCSFQMNGNNRNSLPIPVCGAFQIYTIFLRVLIIGHMHLGH